jgi:hypothetical protein
MPINTPPTETRANCVGGLAHGEGTGEHGGDGQLVDDQAGGVVDQAFAFEDGHQVAREC